MKKLLIIFTFFFLFACTNNSSNLSEDMENLENSGSVTENLENIENSGSIEHVDETQEEQIAQVEIPKRTLVMNGYNVELKEWDKSLWLLTTKGNVTYSDELDCQIENETSYKILQSSWEYGVVLRKWDTCGGPGAEQTIFTIPLNKNIDTLTKVFSTGLDWGSNELTFKDNKIIVRNLWEVVKVSEWPGQVEEKWLQREWYKKQGNDWVKMIDITTVNYPAEKESLSYVDMNSEISKQNENSPKIGIYEFSQLIAGQSDSYRVKLTKKNATLFQVVAEHYITAKNASFGASGDVRKIHWKWQLTLQDAQSELMCYAHANFNGNSLKFSDLDWDCSILIEEIYNFKK